jgi:acetoacetyl-CoA synthetase
MSATHLWQPTDTSVANANLTAFRAAAEVMVRRPLGSYDELHRWSVEDRGAFWQTVWDQCGVVGDPGPIASIPSRDMRAERFFPEARLNVVDTLLRRYGSDAALVAYDERGRRSEWSWDHLRGEVAACSNMLLEQGVDVGDRVAAWLPNSPAALVVMLASAAIGAVYSSTSPDFGTAGVLDRFGQIEPKVLVACDGYVYGGKYFDCLSRLADIARGLPTVTRIAVVGHLAERPDVSSIPNAALFDELLASHRGSNLHTRPLPFDHPWYVLFSSGTTGKPKCIVHRTGGVLLKHVEEQSLQCNIKEGDRVLFYTTTGWMMWNWLASVLGCNATVVLYDGSPFTPDGNVLFDIAAAERLTLLGLSAKFIDSLAKASLNPAATHDLSSIRTICSTGSPLSAEGFSYVNEKISATAHLASFSGGTDLCGCFVAGDPTGPVFAGEIQRPVLGMAVAVFDDAGLPLGPNRAGELVCTAAFPSMPLGFWGDADGARYAAAYFERFPGVWNHGDFASWTDHAGMVIHGRSDTTLNPGGVRIGTAEIYRQVETIAHVTESLVFGQQWEGDTRIVLLVRLQPGAVLDDVLEAEIRSRIRTNCTPRHVPSVIIAVEDLPRTRSNKLVELAVVDVVHGRPVRNTEAIANPEALEAIAARPELRPERR